MDLLFLTARATGSSHHASVPAVAALAATLAGRGHVVRWVQPRAPGAPETVADGVRIVDVPTVAPPFRSVTGRLIDLGTERALSAEIRRVLPDVVHIHGYGGASSCLGPWVSDRLGVATLVVAEPVAESLCHRRTLVDEVGRACSRWDEPARCAACCRVATPEGLGRLASIAANLLRPVPVLSPFPSRVDFENRLDMTASGLASARVVMVADDAGAAEFVRLGLPRRSLRVGIPADPSGWEAVYRELQTPRA